MDYKALGIRIRHERTKRGLTQEQLSELCGISSSYIGIIERGDKKLSIETLVKIANALSLSTDYLLKDSIQFSSEYRMGEIATMTNSLDQRGVDIVVDVISTLSSHLTKVK